MIDPTLWRDSISPSSMGTDTLDLATGCCYCIHALPGQCPAWDGLPPGITWHNLPPSPAHDTPCLFYQADAKRGAIVRQANAILEIVRDELASEVTP